MTIVWLTTVADGVGPSMQLAPRKHFVHRHRQRILVDAAVERDGPSQSRERRNSGVPTKKPGAVSEFPASRLPPSPGP